jgi:hypothetical protein
VKDWQDNPYRWSKEIDMQAELAARLDTVYRLLGRSTVRANYRNAIAGFEGKQRWSRVCCEPRVPFEWQDERATCFPDIAVFDDINDPNSPPDADGKGAFPLLWVCEIKVDLPSGTHRQKEEWGDIPKLRALLQQGVARYACWLTIRRQRAMSGDGIQWDKREERMWQCTAELPPAAGKSG